MLLEELKEKVNEYNDWQVPKDEDIMLEYLNRTESGSSLITMIAQ